MESKSIITIIITTLVFISIVSIVFTGIAYIEKGNKERKLFQNTNSLAYLSIGLFLLITILLLTLEYSFDIQMGSPLMYAILSIIKLIMALYVANKAREQNRSYALWFILGLLEFHASLVALALGKSIYKVPSASKPLFKELTKSTKEKISSLKELTSDVRKSNNSIEIGNEYDIPLMKIKREYSNEFEKLLKCTHQEEHRNTSLQKYERAYKAGIMNKEDYESKVSKLNKQ